VFKLAIPVLIVPAGDSPGVKVLQAAFKEAPACACWSEASPGWPGWPWCCGSAGCCRCMLEELDQISWKVGGSSLSVRNMLEGAR
jgi:hypothetical protein